MSNLRQDTLTRLSECEYPPFCSPFPAPVMPISIFAEMMYKVAYSSGYKGTKTEFTEDFVNCLNGSQSISGLIIQKGSIEDFPEVGVENAVYIDTEKNHIYYWKDNNYYRISTMSGGTISGVLTLSDGSPAASESVVDTKVANAIASAGHLKRLVVDILPEVSEADADTIYMVKDSSITLGDAYKEYMLIDGAMVQIGDTSVNLEPYATKTILTEHEDNSTIHITDEERTAWNNKVDADNEIFTTLSANSEKLANLPAIKTIGSGLTLQEDGTLRTDISAMTGMMRFRGAVSTKPTTSTTVPSDNLGAWRAGDVVLYGTAEYVVASLNTSSQPAWQLLGDEGAYQTKLSFTSTPSLTNKVVTNDTLTSNVNTLDSKITTAQNAASAAQISADNAKNVADAAQADATSALNRIDALDVTDTDSGFVTAVTQTDGKIAVTKKTLAASDVTSLLSFDGTYNASTNKIATASTVTNAIDGLSSSVAAAVASGNQYSVLTGVTQSGGKLTAKTEVKLAAIAVTGNVNDLIQTGGDVLVIYGGTSTTVI